MEAVVLGSEHWDGPFWPGLILLLLAGVLVAMIVFRPAWFGWRRVGQTGGESPTAILQRRLASGEITEETYDRLKDRLEE
jgi:uncharacterized membrane protein